LTGDFQSEKAALERAALTTAPPDSGPGGHAFRSRRRGKKVRQKARQEQEPVSKMEEKLKPPGFGGSPSGGYAAFPAGGELDAPAGGRSNRAREV